MTTGTPFDFDPEPRLTTTVEDGCCTIHLSGALDRNLASAMRDEMTRQINSGHIKAVVLDMENVQTVDSLGVGMIVSAFRSSQAHQVDFAVVEMTEKTSEILRLTGLDNLLPIYANRDEAFKKR